MDQNTDNAMNVWLSLFENGSDEPPLEILWYARHVDCEESGCGVIGVECEKAVDEQEVVTLQHVQRYFPDSDVSWKNASTAGGPKPIWLQHPRCFVRTRLPCMNTSRQGKRLSRLSS